MAHGRGERGPYAKGVAKRAEILDVAQEVIAREGFSGATVKRLAEAVGLSQNGLLRYFGSKDALFIEVVRRRDEMMEREVDVENADLAADLSTRAVDAVTANIAAPGMSKLQLSLTMAASDEDHEGHEFVRQRYEQIRRVTSEALREMQRRGRFPEDGDPAAAAALIQAAFDGLQTQWLFDPTFDVAGSMRYLLRSLGVADGEDVSTK